MPKIRKCKQCGEEKLFPVSRSLQIYNSVIQLECEGCGEKVSVTPVASIGILISVGLLALGFWYFILFGHNSYFDIYTVMAFGVAVAAFLFVTIPTILVHVMNPIAKHQNFEEPDIEITHGEKHIAKRPIIWLERLGMIGGFLAPLIFIAVILGIATLIGYVNFTYFK